jgi:hypothetical protein
VFFDEASDRGCGSDCAEAPWELHDESVLLYLIDLRASILSPYRDQFGDIFHNPALLLQEIVLHLPV